MGIDLSKQLNSVLTELANKPKVQEFASKPPNPNCGKCHGIHVDTQSGLLSACPICWPEGEINE